MWELDYKESRAPKNWCFCGVGENSWESLGLQGDPASPSLRKSVLTMHWKDWWSSWNSNSLATWCEELTHWKRPWCWKRLKAGEGDDRGWDGWMASLTKWTCFGVSSRSWWWTGRPGVLQSMGSQRVGHDWATQLNWSLMYIDAKILDNILARWIQQHIKRFIHHDQVGFISGIHGFFRICKSVSVIHHINKLKTKNHLIISTYAEKAFNKIHPFVIKTTWKVDLEETYLNIIKAINNKPTVDIILNGENVQSFPVRWETRQGYPLSPLFFFFFSLSPLLFNRVLEVLGTSVR